MAVSHSSQQSIRLAHQTLYSTIVLRGAPISSFSQYDADRRSFSSCPAHRAYRFAPPINKGGYRMKRLRPSRNFYDKYWESTRSNTKASPTAERESQMEDTVKKGEIPRDMGLLPYTLIIPAGWMERLRILTSPSGLWRYFRAYLTMARSNISSKLLLQYEHYSTTLQFWKLGKESWKRERAAWGLVNVPGWLMCEEALRLHRTLFEAYAKGNIKVIEEITLEGLSASMSAQISSRSRRQNLHWDFELVGRPKVARRMLVQNADVVLQGSKVIIQQVTVRIRSRQEVSGLSKSLEPEETDSKSPVRTEYMTLQRWITGRTAEPWKVHGFVEETTLNKLAEHTDGGPKEQAPKKEKENTQTRLVEERATNALSPTT